MRYVSHKLEFDKLQEAAALGRLLQNLDALRKAATAEPVDVMLNAAGHSVTIPPRLALYTIDRLRAYVLNDLWGLGVKHPEHKTQDGVDAR